MSLIQFIYTFLLTVPVFLAIDLVWLGYIARDFYQRQLAAYFGEVFWTPAFIFYAIYVAAIIFFAVQPAIAAGSVWRAVLYGALFGFVAYATYDLTNLATIKNWPLMVTIVDLIWGAVLTGTVAGISYLLAMRFVL